MTAWRKSRNSTYVMHGSCRWIFMSPAVISTATGRPPLLFHADTYNPAPINQNENPGEFAHSLKVQTQNLIPEQLGWKDHREHHKILKFTDQHWNHIESITSNYNIVIMHTKERVAIFIFWFYNLSYHEMTSKVELRVQLMLNSECNNRKMLR